MAFSHDDLRNILAGRPTAETMAAAEVTASAAGIAPAPAGPAPRMPLRESSNGNIDINAILERRMQQKAQQPAPPPAAYPPPAAPAYYPPQQAYQQPTYQPPHQGYQQPAYTPPQPGYVQHPMNPGPMGAYAPTAGGVPPSAISQLLGESYAPAPGTPPAYHPQATPPAHPAQLGDLATQVRQILYGEVLENQTLQPILEQLVKANLRIIVREELQRLKEAGAKK